MKHKRTISQEIMDDLHRTMADFSPVASPNPQVVHLPTQNIENIEKLSRTLHRNKDDLDIKTKDEIRTLIRNIAIETNESFAKEEYNGKI